MQIDSHHHYWHYDPVEYDWIDDAMASIRRDFLPSDLAETIAPTGIEGGVSVQARQSLEETNWLLSLAADNEFMLGVVGWVPLADPDIRATLATLANHRKLKAIRHVVQGEPDPEFILGDAFNRGVSTLAEFDLTYDILITEGQLRPSIRFVDRHPEQRFVLDHIAKPVIRDNLVDPWQNNIRELARRENVWCKLSGMVTEADYSSWTVDQLRPYAETVLEAFGPERVMFGSDWPVCLVACAYGRWYDIVQEFISSLSASEQERIMGHNAATVYRLEVG